MTFSRLMFRGLRGVAPALVALSLVCGAHAKRPETVQRSVETRRILLSDLFPNIDTEFAELEYGAAPPPGRSVSCHDHK